MNLSVHIKEKALSLGFDLCGIAPARNLDANKKVLKSWIEDGMNDKMSYLGKDIDRRCDPAILFPGTRSVIVTGISYYTKEIRQVKGVPVISRYAYGNDYHIVVKEKLERLLGFIRAESPGAEGMAYVDSAPLLEKAWARESGLGWQGKHSIIINESIGSFFFIGVLLVNIELDHDKSTVDEKCGSCRLCIESCPTGAINGNRTIDTRKCIANLTIENRGPIPDEIVPNLGGRIYGCDRCQEVCPWNSKVKPINHPEFEPDKEIMEMGPDEWISLKKEDFNRKFKTSAMNRVKYDQLVSNIKDAFRSIS